MVKVHEDVPGNEAFLVGATATRLYGAALAQALIPPTTQIARSRQSGQPVDFAYQIIGLVARRRSGGTRRCFDKFSGSTAKDSPGFART